MRKVQRLALFLAAAIGCLLLLPNPRAAAKTRRERKLLYMTLSAGYRHASIPLSRQIVKQIGDQSGAYETTFTEDVSLFTKQNLAKYDAVMFFTSGELPMDAAQKKALIDFIRGGHGFIGVHSATDTFYLWKDYGDMIGGYFNDHPWHQLVTIEVTDPSSPIVGFLGNSFQITDEIYQIADFKADSSHVLLKLDPQSVNLHAKNVHFRWYGWPLAWTQRYGKGRVFCTVLGHEDAVWQDPRFQKMLLNGIRWTMGDLRK